MCLLRGTDWVFKCQFMCCLLYTASFESQHKASLLTNTPSSLLECLTNISVTNNKLFLALTVRDNQPYVHLLVGAFSLSPSTGTGPFLLKCSAHFSLHEIVIPFLNLQPYSDSSCNTNTSAGRIQFSQRWRRNVAVELDVVSGRSGAGDAKTNARGILERNVRPGIYTFR
jgi:hypothetical protein